MAVISGVKTDAIQIGQSATDSQNFQLSANRDGTIKLARGAAGNLGDLLTVDASGVMSANSKLIFNQGNIRGTVSQSAGVPTGAVVERGSNANGEYVRFADGTQICTGAMPTTALAASTTTSVLVTYPATFVGVYTLSGYGTPDASADFYGVVWCTNNSATTGTFVYRNGSTAQNVISGRYMVVGRWF